VTFEAQHGCMARRRHTASSGVGQHLESHRSNHHQHSLKSTPISNPKSFSINHPLLFDALILVVLTFITISTRTWRLFQPDRVIFDEYHFARFLLHYASGEYFFDIHPPLAKLTLYFASTVFGGFPPSSDLSFLDQIGNQYPPNFNYQSPRAVSAFFGILCIPVLYLTCRTLSFPYDISILTTSFAIFDMNLTIESRLILTDSQLIFYSALTLYLMIQWWKCPTENAPIRRRLILTAVGISCGACISVKYTGLATPALCGLMSLTGLGGLLRKRIAFWECVYVGMVGIGVNLLSWYVHLKLLPYSGTGDAFMSKGWDLIGSIRYDKSVKTPTFIEKVVELNTEMIRVSARISVKHEWQSMFYEWPLTLRGILYYVYKHEQNSHVEWIYLLGNPMVYWTTTACILCFAISCIFRFARRNPAIKSRRVLNRNGFWSEPTRDYFKLGLFLFSGWALNLLPYFAVSRPAFLYHYLPALYYALLLSGLTLHHFAFPRMIRLCICIIGFSVALCVFCFYSPWIYAVPISETRKSAMQWLPRWN